MTLATTRAATIAIALTAAACSSPRPPERKPTPEASDTDLADTKPDAKRGTKIDPCSPLVLGLGEARPVAPWAAPAECSAKSGPAGPGTIRNEAEFRRRFSCPSGTRSGVDFTKQQLVVEDRMLSPAGAGVSIVDDGLRVTFISRMRSPCPDDPQAMPVPYTMAFVLPAGASRSYGNASCTLPRTCS
ncbi:MAG: hypothetical protein IAG13_26715 [Deltaproteobacteria bacterium]|nr:hypothetical protein [Nannocystaceae bacterium]